LENDKRTPTISSSSLKQLEQILAKKQRYVVKQTQKERRDLSDNPMIEEIHLVLQTIIKDLKQQGIFK